MKYMGEKAIEALCTLNDLTQAAACGSSVSFHGSVHKIRDMGDVAFIIVRIIDGTVQCVWSKDHPAFDIKDLCEEACVQFTGSLRYEERAPHGFEVVLQSAEIITLPAAPMPVIINKGKINATIETLLNYRPATLRAGEMRAKFRIQDGVVRGFREYLHAQGFTDIHTPKLVAASAEGGANVFKMDRDFIYLFRRSFITYYIIR